jgi:hypothetical protein
VTIRQEAFPFGLACDGRELPVSNAAQEQEKDGYCYCDMCGYNAKVPARFRLEVEDDHPCPWCKKEDMPSLLCVEDELPDHVIPDEPMMTWPQTKPI